MQLYSIGFFFLAQIPLWISRGEKLPNKPAWIYKKNFIIFTKDHSYCRLQYLLLKPRALLMPGPQLSFLMQEHVPWAPGDLHFYQKARGSKWCIVGQGSHPGQHPRHSLQMPHIPHIPYPLTCSQSSGCPMDQVQGWRLQASSATTSLSPWLSHFCGSGAASVQLMGQGERQELRCACWEPSSQPQWKSKWIKVEQLPREQTPCIPSSPSC